MNRKFPVKKMFSLFLLFLINEKVFANQQKRGGLPQVPKGCSQLRCEKEEQCISRRFWCKSLPCPQMTYCSKSRKESLKGPSSCSSVLCSKGYVCLVIVRNCTWDKNCKQQIARCVTEREYYEGPASCADFQCPVGHTCILRESLCARSPCKILKSCARSTDADAWFNECKNLGCSSEHECFLRRPANNCINPPCKHSPDCILPPENDSNENCRGWICPKNQDCSAQVLGPCKVDVCKVARTCKGPSYGQNTLPQRSSTELKTLTDLERDLFYQEAEKRRLQAISVTTITPAINPKSVFQNSGYDKTRQLFFKPGELPSSVQGQSFEFLNSARSVPKAPSVPVYKYPAYLASTLKPKHIFTPDKTTVKSFTPTPASSWFESLKSRTGIDIVNFWVKMADENQHYMQFQQWLESVRKTLDPEIYRLWLEEVRLTTSYSKKFQDWLPLPVPNQNLNIQQLSDFESIISDVEREVLSAFTIPEIDDPPYKIKEYKEEIGILTTLRTVNKLSGDATKLLESSTFNVSKNLEMEKSPVVPTFIIIQPPQPGPNIFDTQQLIQLMHYYLSDPRFLAARNPINNLMSQVPVYFSLPQNNFPIGKPILPGMHWQHFLNAYPRHYPATSEINRNLHPFNYLNQYFKPFSGWNHADFGYQHSDQEYPAILNNRPEGIYNHKDYFEISDSNFESRKDNWRDYLKKINVYKGGDEDLRSEINRLGRKSDSKFESNPEFLNEKEKEQEIQLLLKILQGIIDYDLEEQGREIKENENRNENKNYNGSEVLLETLINVLEKELDDDQENIKNPILETLLGEIENDDELKKFQEKFSGPQLRRRKGDEIFRSSRISQDSSISSKNSTLVDNINSFIEKYSEVLSRKDYDNSMENLSKFFNPKEQNIRLNVSLQETAKKENTAPEIILPRAGYYDFVKDVDLARSHTSGKNSKIFNKEIKQNGMPENAQNLSKNVKDSNGEYEDD